MAPGVVVMDVSVLGDLEVLRDGTPVPLGGRKPRTLLGLLVAARGRSVSTERLIDQLWGDDPPPKVLAALQVYVAKLRRSLEPGRGARVAPSVLVTRPSGYALVVPDDAVDARRFEDLVSAGGEDRLSEALALWRGTPYAGLLDAPALAAEAQRLGELRLRAVERLWAGRLDAGRHAEAVGPLTALATEHPAREGLWAMLVLALYRSGRQADALEALRRVRAHLADELGIDPGAELRELETAVLRQDESLLVTPGPVPAAPEQLSANPRRSVPGGPPDASHTPARLAGRDDVLARTGAAAACAAAGRGGVLLVTGEPGIGKTTVAQAVLAQAAEAGLRPASGGWEAEGSPPLWGWTVAVGELAASAPDDDTASVTYRLADLVVQRLSGAAGSCLVLDDVQWADADSQRLLRRVADLVPSAPVLVVVLCREPGPDAAPATVGTLAALTRLGADRIALGGLAADDVRTVVAGITGTDPGADAAAAIRERTDGNPFYVRELARWLAAEGALADLSHAAWRAVPSGVRDTVRHRLAELPDAVGDVIASAAVLGRSVDLDLLEAWWQDDLERLDQALDSLLAAGLVVEDRGIDRGNGRVRFAHGLVRDAVYGDLPPLTRRRMHARAAATVERHRVGRLDEHAAVLAEHYRLAGLAHARSAWTYAARAARAATAAGASADAAAWLASASELQATDPLAVPGEREALHLEWGIALRRSGRVAQAWAPLREAAESALARGDAVRAASALLAVTENVLWSWRTAHATDEEAVALWQRVLGALPAGESGLRARILAALSVEAMHDPPGGRCEAWADEALALARRHPDDAVRIDVLQVVLNPLRRPDLLPRRLAAADELVALCVRRGDERALAAALCKRALNHSAFARPDAALGDLQRALGLAERHHLATALMVIRLGMAVLLQAAGEWEASEQALAAAESVQATIAMAGTGIGHGVRATSLLAQGRLAEAEHELAGRRAVHDSLRELHALAIVHAGRPDDARAILGPWREQPELIWDYLWLSGAVLRALVWSELGDQEAVADLRRALEPFADRVADGAMAACFLGSVRHALAALAVAAGDADAAVRAAREARDLHRRLGWAPWERLSQELLDRAERLPQR